jgi:hypothetical protein
LDLGQDLGDAFVFELEELELLDGGRFGIASLFAFTTNVADRPVGILGGDGYDDRDRCARRHNGQDGAEARGGGGKVAAQHG